MPRMTAPSPAAAQRIKDILKFGRQASGQAAYLKYLRGDALPASSAIRAMCYSCLGNCADGSYDCKDFCCPLYPWQPYKEKSTPTYANMCITGKNAGALGDNHPLHGKYQNTAIWEGEVIEK